MGADLGFSGATPYRLSDGGRFFTPFWSAFLLRTRLAIPLVFLVHEYHGGWI